MNGLIADVFGNGNTEQQRQVVSTTSLDDLIGSVFQPATNNPIPSVTDSKLGASGGSGGNGDCECVPYYQCQNGTILDNGVGLIDIRYYYLRYRSSTRLFFVVF